MKSCSVPILAAGFCLAALAVSAAPATVALTADPAPGPATRHGLSQLALALKQQGITYAAPNAASPEAAPGDIRVVAGLQTGPGAAARLIRELRVASYPEPESLLIRKIDRNDSPILLIGGADDRGLLYALLDVADRVGWAADPSRPFSEVRDVVERPDVAERAVSIYTMHRAAFEERFFNEDYWKRYFEMLVRHRFNSFVLIFGYENGGYFAPAYPYFFDVEGFPEVRVSGFTADQQARYLKALNRLVEMAHDRGLLFKAGLWDHIYRGGVQSGGVREADPAMALAGVPTGLTKTNLLEYSRVALAKFLRLVPGLDGVQFRMHNESGLERGREMQEFWRNIYRVIKETRPDLRFDARAKEFPDELIDLGLAMGIRLRITTKYWAEQMGLPFHPTHINRQNQRDRRHGYADLLRYPQRYQMHWRLWNGGTTRILLWGDPEYARRFAQSTHLYDGDGFEVNEMLATKMEAQPHDQPPFELLRPQYRYYAFEFERYWHFFQSFGRMGYNPDTPPEVWQREFQRRFGSDAAPYVGRALHRASWILPRINAALFPYHRFPTTRGWVEKQRWEDLPAYARIEGSDTQQFLGFDEAAVGLIEGVDSAKIHPLATSAWLERAARDVLEAASQAEKLVGSNRNKEFDSTLVDLQILAHLATYHSRRIPAALGYALFTKSRDLNALDEAVQHERRAVAAWEELVQAAGDVYASDLMMGLRSASLSGHWRDELEALRIGLAALEEQRRQFQPESAGAPAIAHVPIRRAAPGSEVVLRATVWGPDPIKSIRVTWNSPRAGRSHIAMAPAGAMRYQAAIPRSRLADGASYFLEAEDAFGNRAIFPADGENQPVRVRITDDLEPPVLEHEPVRAAAPGQPLRITAQVRDPSGVKWVRMLYRGVTQFQDYQILPMQASGRSGEYQAEVPGEDIDARWDFMYLFEVMDTQGNGKIYPELEKETPYVAVKLQR